MHLHIYCNYECLWLYILNLPVNRFYPISLQKFIALVSNVMNGTAVFLVDGLQLIVAVLLMVLGVMVAASCFTKLLKTKKQEEA